MFIDETEVAFIGGHGGAGAVSFGKKMGSGPDGGNGGGGGDIYLLADTDITLIDQFTRKVVFEAGDGYRGGRNRKSGKDGADFEIKLPVGTSVVDKKSGRLLFEIKKVGQRELLCKGGKGGRGNYEFRNPQRTTPEFAQPGLPGEKKEVILNLKLIANYGLIGLPNTGKSSLLNELARTKAKTANYPFTTLTPNLGVFKGKVIADIPGLIEGASAGRGLGVSFLKHIEKVGTLLHCITSESADPLKDYKVVRKELENFNTKLAEKPEILLITKSDLVDRKTLNIMKKQLNKKTKAVLAVSIHDWDSQEKLKNVLLK